MPVTTRSMTRALNTKDYYNNAYQHYNRFYLFKHTPNVDTWYITSNYNEEGYHPSLLSWGVIVGDKFREIYSINKPVGSRFSSYDYNTIGDWFKNYPSGAICESGKHGVRFAEGLVA